MQNNDNGFTSVSVSKIDYKFYAKARDEWCEKHGIDSKKISVASFINTGMTFYIQRMRLGMIKDEDEKA